MAGFADGFRSGFGLISDVKDRELQRDRLEEQARQGDLDRQATAAYRDGQLELGAERNRIDGIKAGNTTRSLENDASRLENDKSRLANDNLRLQNDNVKSKAQASVYDEQARGLKLKTDTEQERLEGIEREQAFALNANQFLEHLKTGASPTARNDEWNKIADQLFEKSYGGLTNPFVAASPATQENLMALQSSLTAMQSGQEVERAPITGILNNMLASSNTRKVGTELTAENTPAAGHLNGKGWRIVGKEVSEDWNVSGGFLTGTVDVTVQNSQGDVAVYNAPLSLGRNSVRTDESGNPVLGENGESLIAPAEPIPVETLLDASAGYYKYAQYAGQFQNEIAQSATRLYDLQNGEGSLQAEVNKKVSDFQTSMGSGSRASEPSFVAGMTNADLARDVKTLNTYMTYAVLDPEKNVPKATRAGDQIIRATAAIPDVKDLEAEIGRGLTRQELLSASHYFTRENGAIVLKKEDIRDWKKFEMNIMGEEEPPKYRYRVPDMDEPD
jgi:hypothetical protein